MSSRLRRTRLCSSGSLQGGSSSAGLADLPVLVASPHLAGLQTLRLHGIQFSTILTALSPLEGLRSLCLSHNSLQEDSVNELVQSPFIRRLTHLTLSHNAIEPAGARAFAAAPNLAGLTTLALSRAGLHDDGLRLLAASPHLTGIRSLDLSFNGFTHHGMREMTVWDLPHLTELDLSGNPLRAGGSQLLAAVPAMETLRRLSLQHCRSLGLRAAAALARPPRLRRLVHLDLEGCGVTAKELELLLTALAEAKLVCLRLQSNQLGDLGAEMLAGSPWLARLAELDLSDNRIGNTGAEALLKSPHLKQVSMLKLTYNQIDDPLLQALRDRFGTRLRFEP